MKKKAILLLLSLSVALTSGCGRKSSQSNADTIAQAEEVSPDQEGMDESTSASGSDSYGDSTPPDQEGSDTSEPVFNTLSNNDKWGDESDFMRIAEIDSESDLNIVNVKELENKSVKLESGHTYAFIIYAHNTSALSQSPMATLSYPLPLLPDQENQANILLSWGGEQGGIIGDGINLEVDKMSGILPVNDGECVLVTDYDGNQDTTNSLDVTMMGRTENMFQIGSIAPDDTRVTFFIFDVALAKKAD